MLWLDFERNLVRDASVPNRVQSGKAITGGPRYIFLRSHPDKSIQAGVVADKAPSTIGVSMGHWRLTVDINLRHCRFLTAFYITIYD
ncbi:hypothetical protein J6590_073075 [Homalodisca vitripennis]|nr:hypothetical protein J6590_073075 [Homalodisca vitripennis]